ncbi:MAG: rRNA maturation RNase YbeY [Gammaproteobacteria bacterium]
MSLIISCLEGYSISNSLNTKLKSVFKTICIEENLSEISINLRIINDKEMTELNRKFRNKDSSTNVLSFTNEDISKTITGNLGDIAINYDYLERESKEQSKSFDDHMIHMLVHGIYHILGFDHKNDEIAKVMERKEITLLNKFKIENPYN